MPLPAFLIPLLASAASSAASSAMGGGGEGGQQAPQMGFSQPQTNFIPTQNPLQSGMESAQRRTKDKKGQFGSMT